MEQRLVIASQILSGLVSLDRVRPLHSRVGAVRHALQLADLLQVMDSQLPPLVLFDPLVELVAQHGPDFHDEDDPPAPRPLPRGRGRPRKYTLQ